MAASPEQSVLIIGAGISGLLIAHGLQKAGIKYLIFETEEKGTFRPLEWTLGLHWSLPLIDQLLTPEKAASLSKEAGVDGFADYEKPPFNEFSIYDGITGNVLKTVSADGRLVRVSRRKLRDFLLKGVDVQHGHTLETLESNDRDGTVTATFTNGATHTGALLVGADGPRSTVRQHLFRSKPGGADTQRVQNLETANVEFHYEDPEDARRARNIHPIQLISIWPGALMFFSLRHVGDPAKPETWRFSLIASWRGQGSGEQSRAQVLRAVKEKTKDFAEPVRSLFQKIPDDAAATVGSLGYWIAEPWDTEGGRIALSGDAAHPMPPFRGQGGNLASQSAFDFVQMVKQIRGADWDRGVQTRLMDGYSEEVAKRGAKEAELSLENGRLMIDYDEFKNSPYMKQGLSKGS